MEDFNQRKKLWEIALLEMRTQELASLNKLGFAVSASLSIEETSSAALQGIVEAVRPDLAFIFLRQDERLILQNVLPPEEKHRRNQIPEHRVGECLCGLAVERKEPIYSLNIHTDPNCTWTECKKAGIRSFAALPIRTGEEFIGVIGLASVSPRDFQSQSGFLETLVHQVSIAMSNARLYETVNRELTERKKAETGLRESEGKYRTLFQSNPQPMWVYDLETLAFLAVNDAAIASYGYSLEEFLSMTIADIRPPEDVARLQEDVKRVGETLFKQPVLWRHRKKDGSIIDVEIASHHLNYQGRSARLVLSYDVTERRRISEEKEKIQAQLLQAQKMESVARLAGGIAHDFNNMLGIILGQTELGLLDLTPPDPMYAILTEIHKAAQRSAELTRQLLAYARKQTVAPKVLDLNTLVENMLKILGRLLGEDIDLAWIPSADLWKIKTDPSQIDQILFNLCVNARDAISEIGKITIETQNTHFDEAYCALHPGFSTGMYVMLAVSDDGKGMDKEVLDHLFEPFFTTKEVGKGTGLGLATVYGIVKQNNGFINVYSEPDQGTTFRIYLPRFSGQESAYQAEVPLKPPRGKGEMILLVEDDTALRGMTRIMLEGLGYGVLTTGTPEEAIEQAKTHTGKIQLLITDVIMPEMNGKELARILEESTPGLKCLFISGYTANVIAHHGVLEEGVNFLPKPFSIKELAVKVWEVLEKT